MLMCQMSWSCSAKRKKHVIHYSVNFYQTFYGAVFRRCLSWTKGHVSSDY